MLNKVFGYLFFLILTFWLSIRSKPLEIQPNDRTFFLEQTNTHSTRGDNILDLVFSRTPEAIKDLTCICPKTMNISSDHALLMFDLIIT